MPTDAIALAALAVAWLAELFVIAALVVSWRWPAHRVWPPGAVSWRFWYYWGLSAVVFAALAVVAWRDAGSGPLDGPVWDALGALAALPGLAFAGWAGVEFRTSESFGLEGELHTGGPYSYSRNPQMVGMALALLGAVLILDSGLLAAGMLPVFVWIAVIPLPEEAWLGERYGEEYERYREQVPRFLGPRSLR